MTQSRKHYQLNRSRMARFRFRANQRAAKERLRIEGLATDPVMPDTSHVVMPRLKPSGFRVTVECLDDNKRVSFTASRLPWGLSISPTAAGRRVATVLKEYHP